MATTRKTTKRKKPSFTRPKQAQFLDNIRAGMRPGAAAEALGFNRDEILDKVKDDEQLAELVEKAEAEATEHVEEALFQAAVSGNVSACKMWLDLRRPQSKALAPVSDEPGFDDELAELNALAAGSRNGGDK